MKPSNSSDSYYLFITDENRDFLQDKLNKDYKEEYEYSLDYYNKSSERNLTLPEPPNIKDFKGKEPSFDKMLTMMDYDTDLYKRELHKPTLYQIDLTDYLILETYT